MIYAKDNGLTLVEHLKHIVKWAKETGANPIAALFHDIGKVEKGFQQRLFKRGGLTGEPQGIEFSNLKKTRHEFLSILILAYFGLKYEIPEWESALRPILWHHRNVLTKISGMTETIYASDFPEAFNGLVNATFNMEKNKPAEYYIREFLRELEENEELIKDILKEAYPELNLENGRSINHKEYIDILKREVKALSSVYEYNDRFAISHKKYNELMKAGALKRADYLGSSVGDIPETNDLKPDKLAKIEYQNYENSWQQNIIDKLPKKQLFILEAPTGSGKTLFAYLLAKKLGVKKLVYVLPYKAALNEKYEKLSKSGEVGLLHSSAVLELDDDYEEKDDQKAALMSIVNTGIKESLSKHLYYPVILTTADQTQIISLEYYGFDEQLSIYDKDVLVVLDEPQAFNADQQAIILKSIEMIKQSGAYVLVMTATMPSTLKEILHKMGAHEIIGIYEGVKNSTQKRHFVKVIELKEEKSHNLFEDLFEELEKRIDLNKRNLIILNQVDHAIEVYNRLKEVYNGPKKKKRFNNVYLMHSRLKWSKKDEIIKKVVGSLKGSSNEPWILVSTQVVEAAVDIDADILFTALSPLPSQIQRWGRVFRNRDGDYTGEPNIYVYGISKKGKINSNEIGKIYPIKTLQDTLDILKNLPEKPLSYKEERDILMQYFDKEKQNLMDKMEELPLFSTEVSSFKEAHYIFRPDDRTIDVVILDDILDELKKQIPRSKEKKEGYVRIYGGKELDGKYINKKDLLKISYSIRKDRLPSNVTVGEILNFRIIDIGKYNKKKAEELGIEAILSSKTDHNEGFII